MTVFGVLLGTGRAVDQYTNYLSTKRAVDLIFFHLLARAVSGCLPVLLE